MQWHLLEHPSAGAITATSAPSGVAVPVFAGADRKLVKVAEKNRELANIEAVADGSHGTVFINLTSGFAGVRQTVWHHTIGGYQVLHKWLDDRRKAQRSLSDDDIAHWRRVYAALQATQALMAQVDAAIEQHGGWPGAEGDPAVSAFSQNHPPPAPAALVVQQAMVKSTGGTRATVAAPGLFDEQAAEEADSKPQLPAPASTRLPPAFDDNGAMRAIRAVLSEHCALSRDELLRQAAYALGHQRLGKNTREELDGAVRRAVRRGVAENDGEQLRLLARSLEDYERPFLKEQFLASLSATSRGWTEREDALHAFKAWMGYGKLGPVIGDTVRSLVNGLLREGRLEAEGSMIRRVIGA